MSKVKDIRNFLNSRKEADSPALEIKKSTQAKKTCISNVPEKIKTEVGTYAMIHGTKNCTRTFQ